MWKTRLLATQGPLLVSCLLVSMAGCGGSAASTETSQGTLDVLEVEKAAVAPGPGSGVVMAARKQAADEDKYLFAFFSKTEAESTSPMRKLFDDTMVKLTDRANTVAVNVTDPAEREIVDEYGLDRAPMPLVLAIAPNGAITGGFPIEFSEQDLLSAFASPVTQRCIKLLQDGKIVLLCVQSDQTDMNEEAMQGVKDFTADDRFREAAEIVSLDPSDEAEGSFLKDLQVDPATKTAVTVFLAPPGAPIAMFEGPTTKDQLVAELEKAGSCGPGGTCGPGGCGPGGCPPK